MFCILVLRFKTIWLHSFHRPCDSTTSAPPPATIIIDEPELGLHPAAIEILANLIEVASRSTQVIVATQSPLLLDKFNVEDIIIARRDNGATAFERLDEEKIKLWLDDYSLGELWVKDVIRGGVSHE